MLLRLPLIIMCAYCTLALVVLLFRSRGGTSRSAAWLILGVIAWHAGIRLPFILTQEELLQHGCPS